MNKNIPESFDKAVKDIEEGNTVPLDTALKEEPPTESETFKKICKEIEELFDEKAKLEENLDRALKAWTEAVSERTNALLERDEYKIGHDRYEKLRRLNLREMKELYLKHLRSLEHFDTLVDKL
jgi:exonuclease VII small subunit